MDIYRLTTGPVPVLDATIPLGAYVPLDLSVTNEQLKGLELDDPQVCQRYIHSILEPTGAKVAYGGYLEHRNLYARHRHFTLSGKSPRNIHLGLDLWAPAGTSVLAPLPGKVHSFQNNDATGDYGPTLILEHDIDGFRFYTLYGHLSEESLFNLQEGLHKEPGDIIGFLGTEKVNGGYAPHLHFQLILHLHGNRGDFPGVCSREQVPFYSKNCPDPDFLLKIPS